MQGVRRMRHRPARPAPLATAPHPFPAPRRATAPSSPIVKCASQAGETWPPGSRRSASLPGPSAGSAAARPAPPATPIASSAGRWGAPGTGACSSPQVSPFAAFPFPGIAMSAQFAAAGSAAGGPASGAAGGVAGGAAGANRCSRARSPRPCNRRHVSYTTGDSGMFFPILRPTSGCRSRR